MLDVLARCTCTCYWGTQCNDQDSNPFYLKWVVFLRTVCKTLTGNSLSKEPIWVYLQFLLLIGVGGGKKMWLIGHILLGIGLELAYNWVFSKYVLNNIKIFLMILPCMSLDVKLVPVGYREYEDSLLRKKQKNKCGSYCFKCILVVASCLYFSLRKFHSYHLKKRQVN